MRLGIASHAQNWQTKPGTTSATMHCPTCVMMDGCANTCPHADRQTHTHNVQDAQLAQINYDDNNV